MKLNVFLVAGEASADLHGASLLHELKRLHPEAHCFGVGGKNLIAEGMEVVVPSESLSVIGASDWLGKAGTVVGAYREVSRQVKRRRPDIAILLDLPDFNLMIAGVLKKMGVPVCYYISPQVWAWRKYRLKKIKSRVDEMMVLFPFEKEFYEREGMNVTFVGHPLLESLEAKATERSQDEITKAPRIALLPGSRKSEIRYHAEILKRVAAKLRRKYPNSQFIVPIAPTLEAEWVKREMGVPFLQYATDTREVLKWADVAAVASGTATLETALIGVPFCLFYKVSVSSAWIFKTFAGYRDFIGMPNLLRKKEVVREFFQKSATDEDIFGELAKLIENEAYRKKVTEELSLCRQTLGSGGGDRGASQKAALRIHRVLQARVPLERNNLVFSPST
jgi:lipid-A-disaccharide synthase